MNERIENLMYHTGLTAQGCWDKLDEYDKAAIEKFAESIVRECAELNFRELGLSGSASFDVSRMIKQHFGVEE